MAKSVTRPRISVTITVEITEEEARALDALAGYGADAALEAFYAGCGKSYLQPYEKGLRSFLSSIQKEVAPAISEVDRARTLLSNTQ